MGAKNHKADRVTLILKRRPGFCYFCGIELTYGKLPFGTPLPPNYRTRDHLIPKSRGGTGWHGNIVLACFACNHDKSNMTEAEYVAWIAAGRPKRTQEDIADDWRIYANTEAQP